MLTPFTKWADFMIQCMDGGRVRAWKKYRPGEVSPISTQITTPMPQTIGTK